MGRIYQGQSALRIRVNAECDLSQMNEGKLCYLKPDRTRGEYPVVVENELEGIAFYDVQPEDLDQEGWWLFWLEAIFMDGRRGIGEKRKVFLWG